MHEAEVPLFSHWRRWLKAGGSPGSSQAPRPVEPQVDAEGLRAVVAGDEEILRVVVEAYQESWQAQIAELERAHLARDADAAYVAAHTLHGTLRSLCATRAAETAAQLELAAAGGQLSDASGEVAGLRQCLAAIETELLALVDPAPPPGSVP